VDTVDREKLRWMRDAGCREIDFGIESFDDVVLELMCKHSTAAANARAVELAHDAGIPVRLYMMISTPGETYRGTVKINKRYLEQLHGKYSVLCLNTFMPMPGTPIYERPEDYGVRFISRDLSRFMSYQYRREDGVVTNEPWSPIEITGLTREQQMENIRGMHEFADTLKATNKGVSI
jgi:radical SAM superfamily enzyme YgiQ (UPF0313 family)